MSKKKLVIIIAAAIVFLIAAGVAAFLIWGEIPENILQAENNYSKKFSFSSRQQSPDITVDGLLDEAVWEGKGWWKNTYLSNVGGNMPSMKLTAFPTQYGVYIGSVVYDSNLTSDGQRTPGSNSNWELYISACDVGESLFSAENNGSWSVKRIYVDMLSESFTYYNDFDRAVTVEGELNGGATSSATLEMFIPWSVLDVDITKGIPESIGIVPCYRAVLQAGVETSWMSPIDANFNSTTSAYIFDSTGYRNADKDNCVVGDGNYGYAKSRGWDLSQIDDGIVRSVRGGWSKLFFTQQFGSNFIVEATIVPVSAVNDNWPKAGFTFQLPDGQHHTVFLDAEGADGLIDSVNNSKNFPGYQIVTLNQTNGWNQATLTDYDKTNANAKNQEGVKLTVVKYGSSFWYFADGKYLTSETVTFMDGDVMPGFWSLGMDAIYKDYSCKAINQEQLTAYLNENGLYVIDASVEGPGGTVTADKGSLQAGESYTLSITVKSGFRTASVTVNGEDILADIRSNAQNGVYTVKNVQGNQKVIVKFEKCSEVTYSGTVTDGAQGVGCTMILENQSDKSLYYVLDIPAKKEFAVTVPAGTYQMIVQAEGYKGLQKVLDLTASAEETLLLTKSVFAQTQQVNGKAVVSAVDKYDMTYEYEDRIYGSSSLGTRGDSLYFNGSGSDFVAQVTMRYSSDFSEGGDFQSDLIGGFNFNDGSNNFAIWARETGIIHTVGGWHYVMGIFPRAVLMSSNSNKAVYAVAKLGDTVYVYIDGREVYSAKWSELAPNMDAGSDIAVGLNMWTDKKAELEFSEYSVNFDTAYVTEFVNSH